MPEIGLFGSEGGAPTHGVPTLSMPENALLRRRTLNVERRTLNSHNAQI
jgi:hypothetical protein